MEFKLSNGLIIPEIGFGTWMIPNNLAKDAVKNAIEQGYNLIDTAEAYMNEEGVAKGIREAGYPRNYVFLTTKLDANAKDLKQAKKCFQDSYKKLDLGPIDLMLIHSPQPWNEFRDKEKRYFKENLEIWGMLEEEYLYGRVRAIGVSNFQIDDLKNIIDNCNVKPMVNQILAHIGNMNFELINYCKDNDIVVEAYSPFGHGPLLKNDVIIKMADWYGVKPANICIKYLMQHGLIPLPKASSVEHIKENLNLDFTISESDMKKLDNIKDIDYEEYKVFPVFSNK